VNAGIPKDKDFNAVTLDEALGYLKEKASTGKAKKKGSRRK
jgi:topoisomerase IA-like protein